MRQTLTISVPQETADYIKKQIKKHSFASTSEYIRHLIRQENTHALAQDFKKAREEFRTGKAKKLHSLRDLIK